VGACLASERPALPASKGCPGGISERLLVLPLDRSLESCRELRSLSRAGPARTKAPFRGRGPLAQKRPFAGEARSHKARSYKSYQA